MSVLRIVAFQIIPFSNFEEEIFSQLFQRKHSAGGFSSLAE